MIDSYSTPIYYDLKDPKYQLVAWIAVDVIVFISILKIAIYEMMAASPLQWLTFPLAVAWLVLEVWWGVALLFNSLQKPLGVTLFWGLAVCNGLWVVFTLGAVFALSSLTALSNPLTIFYDYDMELSVPLTLNLLSLLVIGYCLRRQKKKGFRPKPKKRNF